jgi:hypothetical protein
VLIVDVGRSMGVCGADGSSSGLDKAKQAVQMSQSTIEWNRERGTTRCNARTRVLRLRAYACAHRHILSLCTLLSMMARTVIQRKLLFTKQDELCILLLGTEDTENALHEEDNDSYHHVRVFKSLQKPDLAMLESIRYEGDGRERGARTLERLSVVRVSETEYSLA